MVRSRAAAGAGHPWLEWGMDSPEPGSAVRDARGRPVFTGSSVRRVTGGLVHGTVVELLSRRAVLVRWEASVDPRTVQAADLIVVK